MLNDVLIPNDAVEPAPNQMAPRSLSSFAVGHTVTAGDGEEALSFRIDTVFDAVVSWKALRRSASPKIKEAFSVGAHYAVTL